MSVATTDHCNGCGAEVEPQEEGRCAFCRADDRGDDQLLAHDSRGYLDVDGKTRVPCGCGCGKAPIVDVPRDPLLDVVRDIVGHGQQVPIRLPEMPVKWRCEWIERLGGVIVIDPDAAMPLAMQRDKGNGDAPSERSEMSNGKRPRGYWTRGRIIEAIRAWAREHGEPPAHHEWRTATFEHPAAQTVAVKCGSWTGAIREAGFEPRVGGPRKHEATRPLTPEPLPEFVPEPEPEPGPAADLEPIAPPPLPVTRDPDKVDVFDLLGSVVTPELIAWHEDEAKRHTAKAAALRGIKDELDELEASV